MYLSISSFTSAENKILMLYVYLHSETAWRGFVKGEKWNIIGWYLLTEWWTGMFSSLKPCIHFLSCPFRQKERERGDSDRYTFLQKRDFFWWYCSRTDWFLVKDIFCTLCIFSVLSRNVMFFFVHFLSPAGERKPHFPRYVRAGNGKCDWKGKSALLKMFKARMAEQTGGIALCSRHLEREKKVKSWASRGISISVAVRTTFFYPSSNYFLIETWKRFLNRRFVCIRQHFSKIVSSLKHTHHRYQMIIAYHTKHIIILYQFNNKYTRIRE